MTACANRHFYDHTGPTVLLRKAPRGAKIILADRNASATRELAATAQRACSLWTSGFSAGSGRCGERTTSRCCLTTCEPVHGFWQASDDRHPGTRSAGSVPANGSPSDRPGQYVTALLSALGLPDDTVSVSPGQTTQDAHRCRQARYGIETFMAAEAWSRRIGARGKRHAWHRGAVLIFRLCSRRHGFADQSAVCGSLVMVPVSPCLCLRAAGAVSRRRASTGHIGTSGAASACPVG